MDKKKDRRFDLSTKFMKMGQSLMIEGREDDDIPVAQIGTILIFMSGLLISEDEDIMKFSDLCAMFSAKKILDSMHNSDDMPLNPRKYDAYIDKINKLRRNESDDSEKSEE